METYPLWDSTPGQQLKGCKSHTGTRWSDWKQDKYQANPQKPSSGVSSLFFKKILFSTCYSGRMLISSLCSKSLIWILASFHPLMIPCRFFFISLNAAFISSFMLLLYSMSSLSNLITSVLNSASIDCLSPFHVVLAFGPYFFVSSIWQPLCVCFCVLGRAALARCLSAPVKLRGAGT